MYQHGSSHYSTKFKRLSLQNVIDHRESADGYCSVSLRQRLGNVKLDDLAISCKLESIARIMALVVIKSILIDC